MGTATSKEEIANKTSNSDLTEFDIIDTIVSRPPTPISRKIEAVDEPTISKNTSDISIEVTEDLIFVTNLNIKDKQVVEELKEKAVERPEDTRTIDNSDSETIVDEDEGTERVMNGPDLNEDSFLDPDDRKLVDDFLSYIFSLFPDHQVPVYIRVWNAIINFLRKVKQYICSKSKNNKTA